jgi:hypothetical protein
VSALVCAEAGDLCRDRHPRPSKRSKAPQKCRTEPLPFFPQWDGVYCLVPCTPSPYAVQNLENKGSNFSLRARSLSLRELHAKSREHGSYGWHVGARGPFWNWRRSKSAAQGCFGGSAFAARPRSRAVAWVRLSKTDYYRVDNIFLFRLSNLKHSVKPRNRRGRSRRGETRKGASLGSIRNTSREIPRPAGESAGLRDDALDPGLICSSEEESALAADWILG